MSRASDAGYFFQTAESEREAERKSAKASNAEGDPIKLSSKILAIIANPLDKDQVFVAESAATARRVKLRNKDISHVYRGPTAPLTCLSLSPDFKTLLAGCWDKCIWSWDVESRQQIRRFHGHADFVKAVLCVRVANLADVNHTDILISGSADTTIICWSLSTGSILHTLKGHVRGILDLALKPSNHWMTRGTNWPSEVTVFSAGSDREIRRWKISLASAAEVDPTKPINFHETSVNKLRFYGDDASHNEEDLELWTAASDNTAKCIVRQRAQQSIKCSSAACDWEVDTTLQHPDFVRDVVVDEQSGFVITACRDENVRIWEKGSAELLRTYGGHFEEVTGLVLQTGLKGSTLVSVSIDGTIRQWDISRTAIRHVAKHDEADRETSLGDHTDLGGKADANKSSLLTEDEERELAELLDDHE